MDAQQPLDPQPGKGGTKKVKEEKKGPGRKQLTIDRTFLSQERTLLAATRTATTLMTFGFALFKFLENQALQQVHSPMLDVISPRVIGLIMLLTGMVGLVLAIFRHYQAIVLLKQYVERKYFSPALLQAYVILILIVLLTYGTLIR
ncbi:DUF202 domain-containing protein [Oscillatoria amoena NRMC-F 0135]|nr:DUF202 domain-containing protein [Oscillatoria amoena NRMC-F 0135]